MGFIIKNFLPRKCMLRKAGTKKKATELFFPLNKFKPTEKVEKLNHVAWKTSKRKRRIRYY